MNLRSILILLISFSLFLVSCENAASEGSVEDLKKKYEKLSLDKNTKPEELRGAMVDLAAAYEREASSQEGEAQAEYLYKSAELYEGFGGDINKALEIYDKIMADFPDAKRAGDALFKKGFLYNEKLKDLEKARAAYELFIEKYPNSDLVDDAKDEIKFLGLTPEEIFEIIQQKQDSLQSGDSIQ
ncbi:MAG: tetratricopeptide repeat protein [Bacteroidota bacterium]